uniref:Voltage-dependent anion-selective channel protein n=1 Tax=Hyaloperonospora arabidopsidis (strain Emoy2) TaxID=559515 RepID=M4C016_HYAAE
MVVQYKDLAKTAENVLRDDYDFSRKLKIKSTASNGVSFTTEGALSGSKSILAKVSSGFTHGASGVVFKKLQITTQGRVITEAELPNVLTEGLKLTFKLEDGSVAKTTSAKQVGVLGAEFKHKNVAVNSDADFVANTVSAAAVISQGNYSVGGQTAFNVDKSALVQHNVGASFTGADFVTSLVTKRNFAAFQLSFHHHLSHKTVYAAVLDYDLKSASNSLVVGGRYKADHDTTYCGKINSEGFLSLATIQRVRPYVTLTTSVHVDAKNFEGDSHKFGLGLTLG